jgi:hypothetical protein
LPIEAAIVATGRHGTDVAARAMSVESVDHPTDGQLLQSAGTELVRAD